jgi:oxygen-dependent protoporphyrinogen oxidase
MSPGANVPQRIAVIGGGIAGLAAANRLRELAPSVEVALFEAGPLLGGILRTERRGEFLLEHGADSFITNLPFAVDLCQRIGFAEQLIPTNDAERRAFIVRRGKLLPVPEGFALMAPSRLWPVLASPILSPLGKLRLAYERFVPPRRDDCDESLGDFARRRLGREVFERLVQPLVGGIYTADPERLSLAATLPRFQEMERRYGSLTRGAKQQGDSHGAHDALASGARYSLFTTPRAGLESLASAVAARLPAGVVRLNSPVTQLQRIENRWELTIAGDSANQLHEQFDAVILAVPAPAAARLLAAVDPELTTELNGVPYASAAVVSLAYPRRQIAERLDGFGFVVPAIERRRILSVSFSSVKFPGRAPADVALFRVFIGGACQGELLAADDDDLGKLAQEELAQLMGISGAPILTAVARWPESMPQYHLGHLERVGRIEARVGQMPGLALAGNAYRGVGIPQVIHSGELSAERVAPLAPCGRGAGG